MDLPTLLSLKENAPPEVVISYDIGCQWGRNLWKRIEVYGEDLKPLQCPDQVIVLVPPSSTLPAHVPSCQEEFCFLLECKVGQNRRGSPGAYMGLRQNAVASSTKEMGPGSRQDTLDDHWSDHNWRKNTNLRECLSHSPVHDK